MKNNEIPFLNTKKYFKKEQTKISSMELFVLYTVITIGISVVLVHILIKNSEKSFIIEFAGCLLMFGLPIILYIAHYINISNLIRFKGGIIVSSTS